MQLLYIEVSFTLKREELLFKNWFPIKCIEEDNKMGTYRDLVISVYFVFTDSPTLMNYVFQNLG